MAFTTEFVMGAGGAVEVEEIPVSMSGGGSGNVYPLTTVDAGTGAWVWVEGAISPGSTGTTTSPQLRVGSRAYAVVGDRAAAGGWFTGSVSIDVANRSIGATSFTGKVYVTRM